MLTALVTAYLASVILLVAKLRLQGLSAEMMSRLIVLSGTHFFHELTHAILGTMKHELNNDEQFVSTFSSFLTEAMADAKFIDKD